MAENQQERPRYQFIEPEELEEIEAYVRQNGLENIADFMSNKVRGAENETVKIAVTGRSGTGKSTFINSFRGLTAEADGAALVSVVESEATRVPKEYRHPKNKNISLWDLPGIGTTQFNQENYEEKVNFDSYDFFIIIVGNRNFEKDVWLAKRAQLRHKKYVIVRTHIDAAIKSDKEDHPRTHDAEQLLEKIRNETKKSLEEQGVYPEDDVYLISARLCHVAKKMWDYQKLEHAILHGLPRKKREVLTLSFSNVSEDLIKKKCDIFRSRVWSNAIFLAVQGFVPSPINKVLPKRVTDYFNSVMNTYIKALGLDEESLTRLSQRTGVELESLILLTTKKIGIPIKELSIMSAMGAVTAFHTPGPARPLVGLLVTLAGYGAAYKSAHQLLYEILHRFEFAAIDVLHAVIHSANE